jgi:hypothetical protein
MSCDFIFLCTPKACLFHLIREGVRGRCLACMQNVGSMEKNFRVCNKIALECDAISWDVIVVETHCEMWAKSIRHWCKECNKRVCCQVPSHFCNLS